MIRRAKTGDVSSPAPTSGGRIPAGRGTPHGPANRKSHGLSTPVLFTIICAALFGCVLLLSFLSPSSVQEVENEMIKAEQLVEDEAIHLFGGGTHERVVPPIVQPEFEQREKSVDATDAMLKQDSSWVDGEKKLKQKLKILAARQAQGKDLGVPVLTRYLGEDIPAWAGEGVDVEEWKKKVEQKYDEMRKEENHWRAQMAEFMDK